MELHAGSQARCNSPKQPGPHRETAEVLTTDGRKKALDVLTSKRPAFRESCGPG